MIKYTKEQKDFLIQNNYKKSAKDLSNLFNKKFGTNITPINIKSFRGNNHLNSGLTGQFEKGNIPMNKGKKWNDYLSKEAQEKCRKTTYKKGNIPKNYKEIGSERINVDGYIEIKIANPNKWDLKHRVLYEQHYGKIPEGYNLIFADGNKLNISLNNLILVSDSELLIMNRNSLIYKYSDFTKIGANIAKIKDKVNKVKNERL